MHARLEDMVRQIRVGAVHVERVAGDIVAGSPGLAQRRGAGRGSLRHAQAGCASTGVTSPHPPWLEVAMRPNGYLRIALMATAVTLVAVGATALIVHTPLPQLAILASWGRNRAALSAIMPGASGTRLSVPGHSAPLSLQPTQEHL
jgi:hypothetical protein